MERIQFLLFFVCVLQLYQSSEVNAAGNKKKGIKLTAGVWIKRIGCFREQNQDRAIPSVEDSDDRDRIILDRYRKREDAVKKCALVAMRLGYTTFGVRRQGLCATGPEAHETYNKYGPSNRCRNGKGAKWANTVYTVSGHCRRRTKDEHCCVFPFTYEGVEYNKCIRKNRGRPWCAITPNYRRDGQWGYCKHLKAKPFADHQSGRHNMGYSQADAQTTNISTTQVSPSLPQQRARSIE